MIPILGSVNKFFRKKAVARKEACGRIAGLMCQLGSLSPHYGFACMTGYNIYFVFREL
ncbi:hypothetical protein Lspi_2794 [Legionella spiritensis]|uniref:Uncharacterized protein n=1 Tax=Legionella spiritensis TaxID=452 RepID=A0A0W0YXC9_LEGSP|nr:hypothetical protein Lspi_2794 [Legionella spiritensis]SNV28524.1 Uncharacterised protein [Legionella spiritensis]